MLNKDKICIVIYWNVDEIDDARIPELMDEIARQTEFMKDGSVLSFVIPVHGRETKVECINPKLVSEQEYEEAVKACEKVKEYYNKLQKEQNER